MTDQTYRVAEERASMGRVAQAHKDNRRMQPKLKKCQGPEEVGVARKREEGQGKEGDKRECLIYLGRGNIHKRPTVRKAPQQ